jgi:hypothetical protein
MPSRFPQVATESAGTLPAFRSLPAGDWFRIEAMVDLKQLKLQCIRDYAGEKTGVVLPIEQFRELLEDLEDLAIMAERREEPTISHEELLAEL